MNRLPKLLRASIVVLLLLSLVAVDVAPASAGLAPSRVSGTTVVTSVRGADILLAQRALENKVVAQKLRDYGVSPADARAKLANMSDQDVHTLASAAKGLPSGGSGATGALIGVLVVVILVIVVLRLMHHDVIMK